MSERSVDLFALLGGAATLARSGNRVAAIVTLESAVALAPDDLTAHRRLAAAYAIAGEHGAARAEYERFVARLEARGALDAAANERSYGSILLAAPSPNTIAAPARRLTAEQAIAIRRIGIAALTIVATLAAMLAAGAEIFARGL